MKIKLHVVCSDAAHNMEITLQHTNVVYPTRTVVHEVEIEIPNMPHPGFAIDRITLVQE